MPSLSQESHKCLRSVQERYEIRNPLSSQQHQRASSFLPGGNTRSVLHGNPFPICMAKGQKNRLTDVDGHEYLDFIGDMTAGIYGHSHPFNTHLATQTMANLGMNLGAATTAEADFAEAICDRFASIERVRFCNSGTEANIYALSVARQVTGRSKVVVFEGAYHGGVLSFAHGVASNNVDKHEWVLGQYNDAEGAVRLIEQTPDLAAVLVEPMQGAGGCIPGTAEFLHAIQKAVKEEGAIFILDEVMTSRLAPGGLQSAILHPEHGTPLSPDLTTLGKWIGGSFTIGAFGGRKHLMSVYDPRTSSIQHSGTFNNNTLSMNVGCEAMTSVYTAEACNELNELGVQLRERLHRLARGTKMVVTGAGAAMTIHFVSMAKEIIKRVSDLKVEPDSVEDVLRDLLWFYLIGHGFWIARRGMVCLILGTTRKEVDWFTDAVKAFLEEYRELVAL